MCRADLIQPTGEGGELVISTKITKWHFCPWTTFSL